MTAELVHVPRGATLPEKMAYAEALAFSGMLPEQYRHQPANLLWAIEYGETIGITPMAAITGVHMIEGKPTASAALISGLVRRAGHRLRSGYDAKTRTGWAEIVRHDDPDFTFRAEWDLNRAIEAELCTVDKDGNPYAKDSKGRSKPWKKFFPSMTKARAITEVARDACEEVLFGLHYTPEELGAETDDEGNLIEPRYQQSRPSAPRVDQWSTPAPAPAPAAEPPAATAVDDGIEDAEILEDAPTSPGQLPPPSPLVPTADQKQQARMAILLKEKRGITDNDEARAAIAAMVCRPLKSRTELSKAEANSVITALVAEPDFAPLEDNPVRDILATGIADAASPDTLDAAGQDIAKELARGSITPAEAEWLKGKWMARRDALRAEHAQMAGASA